MPLRDTDYERLLPVLERAWRKPFTVQSEFFRRHAAFVAMAASLQLITTCVDKNTFSSEWHITIKGQRWLSEAKEARCE